MEDAKVRKGYTRIANKLLEKISASKLTQNEIRVLLSIARLSFGWGKHGTEKRASTRVFSEMTGLRCDKICAAVKGLKEKRVILVKAGSQNEYEINTIISQWLEYPESGLPKSGLPESGEKTPRIRAKDTPNQGKNHPESGYLPCANQSSGAGLQTPKEIKEIKERKKEEQTPPDFSKIPNTIKALGLPATAILSPRDHDVLNALLESGCNFSDIEQARIKRKKNRLEWIQDTVCEMRDARLSTIAKIDHNGIPILPSGRMDWDNMTYDQKMKATQLRYEA